MGNLENIILEERNIVKEVEKREALYKDHQPLSLLILFLHHHPSFQLTNTSPLHRSITFNKERVQI